MLQVFQDIAFLGVYCKQFHQLTFFKKKKKLHKGIDKELQAEALYLVHDSKFHPLSSKSISHANALIGLDLVKRTAEYSGPYQSYLDERMTALSKSKMKGKLAWSYRILPTENIPTWRD